MPRGVYDRSKAKKRGSAAAEHTPAKAPGRPGRKPKIRAEESTQNVATRDASRAETTAVPLNKASPAYGLNSLRETIGVLSQARQQTGGNEVLIGAIDNVITRAISKLDTALEEAFPEKAEAKEEAETEEKVETRNGTPAPAPTAVGALPFNPPAFTSGQA